MTGAVGENNAVVATGLIVEGNSFSGDRWNFLYDDLNLSTVALNDSESNIFLGNRRANNVVSKLAIKHDMFDDGFVKAQRAAAGDPRKHGYRPQAVRGWSALYGVGSVDTVVYGGDGNPEFIHEFIGLNSSDYLMETGASKDPMFTLDKSGTDTSPRYDPANTGGGDYKPRPGSVLIGRAHSASIDVDQRGVARGAVFSAGAIEGAAATAVGLAPASAAQATRASSGAIGWRTVLAVAAGRLATTAKAGVVSWTAGLAPAGARSPTRAGTTAAVPSPVVPPAAIITAPADRTLVVTGDLIGGTTPTD